MIRCLCEDCKHNDGEGFCNDAGYFYPTINYGNMGLPMCEDYDDSDAIYEKVENGGAEPPKEKGKG